jgi:hypothetical protein
MRREAHVDAEPSARFHIRSQGFSSSLGRSENRGSSKKLPPPPLQCGLARRRNSFLPPTVFLASEPYVTVRTIVRGESL